MVDQMQISRRTMLAGAALAGALGPILSATSALGQGLSERQALRKLQRCRDRK